MHAIYQNFRADLFENTISTSHLALNMWESVCVCVLGKVEAKRKFTYIRVMYVSEKCMHQIARINFRFMVNVADDTFSSIY